MKKIKYYFPKTALVCAALLFSMPSFSQSFADSLAEDDRDIVVSVAPYQADVRSAILDVAQYPQVLVKLERIQSRSSQSFQDLIAAYPQQDQEKFYEASRFPVLVNQLVNNGQKNTEDVKPFLKDYPQLTQDRILDVYNSHFDDLVKMNALYLSSQRALEKVTASYPQHVQTDFTKIVAMPDVMNLLTDNIDLTMSLGESYKADPAGITRQLDSLNGALATQNTQELEAYKKEVQSNPQLQDEMKKAADDYSTTYNQPVTYVTNNAYDNYPYPYWFSYPTWYSSPMWYPQPMYYQTGYYIGQGGGIVVIGLPSRGYSNWFFNAGYRRYPLMYNHYRSYYNFHRAHFNSNFYGGFHYESRNHFSNMNRIGRNRNDFNMNNRSMNRQRNANFNQMHMQPDNFNNRGYNHFNAGSFHNSGWNNVGGGRGGFGGGGRGFGGGFGGGRGGGGFGGGHGGGGRR